MNMFEALLHAFKQGLQLHTGPNADSSGIGLQFLTPQNKNGRLPAKAVEDATPPPPAETTHHVAMQPPPVEAASSGCDDVPRMRWSRSEWLAGSAESLLLHQVGPRWTASPRL